MLGTRWSDLVLHGVFILSGIAALFYQLIWQRSLLVLYGSNTESITLIVSAFLVGLGFGALAGGAVSQRAGRSLLLLVAIAEALIASYGLVSLRLFHWVGEYTLGAGGLETGVLAFVLVLIPTLLMGSTLPLLVAYRVGRVSDVGRSVSWLYFVNTLGASIGALLVPFIFFRYWGLSGTVHAAVAFNLISSAAIFLLWIAASAVK